MSIDPKSIADNLDAYNRWRLSEENTPLPYTKAVSQWIDQAAAVLRSAPTGIEASVCDDIARRQALGIAKYGQTVADNPLELRAWLQHAYEETLDKAVYLKRAIAELDKPG